MDSSKFDRMVLEFPFLIKIFADEHFLEDLIEDIQVRRADRNLLEVMPGSWNFDAGSFSQAGFRHFWIVSQGEIIRLKDSSYKDVAYFGGGYLEKAGLIANQLVEFLDREIGYIIEVTNDWFDRVGSGPTVIIYKMQGFAWRRFCQLQQVTQS